MHYTKPKIAIIGAGNIGGTIASLLARKKVPADTVLFDIKDGQAKGKALDIGTSSTINSCSNFDIVGTSDYADIAGADVVIITAGVPRTQGVNSREELLATNLPIIKTVGDNVAKYAPDAFVIMVTNPLDTLTHAFQKYSGLETKKVVGMAGVLDCARFRYHLSKIIGITSKDIHSVIIGAHNDTMLPLLGCTSVGGIPLAHFLRSGQLSEDLLATAIEDTRKGGATVFNLLGTASAYYAPAVAAIKMMKAYLYNQNRILPCSVYMNGEYGISNIYVGAPAIIGKNGVEKVINIELNAEEKLALAKSVDSIRNLQKLAEL